MSRWFTALLLLFVWAGYAQETENTAQYEYSMLHNKNATSLSKHFAALNLKQDVGKSKLLYTLSLSSYNLDYDMLQADGFNSSSIDNVTSLKLGITYLHPISTNWEAMVQLMPELTAAFKNTTIKDVYPGFFAGVRKTVAGNKASVLTLGVGYKGYFGKFRFMPIVSYHKTANEKLSFTVGIPAIDLAYTLNPQHQIKAVAFADAFYSNIRGEEYTAYAVPNTTTAIKALEMVNVNAGLEYNYFSQAQWTGTLKAGYSIYNSLKLKESHGNTNLDLNNNIYISVGFKYNLNF